MIFATKALKLKVSQRLNKLTNKINDKFKTIQYATFRGSILFFL